MIPVHSTSNLRLEVEGAPAAAIPNRFPDQDGIRGTYLFWVTGGSITNTLFSTGEIVGGGFWEYKLQAGAGASTASVMAQNMPVTGGKWYRPRYTMTSITAGHELRTFLSFYDSAGVLLAGGLSGTSPTTTGGGGIDTAAYGALVQAPATAAFCTFAFVIYKGAVSNPIDAGALATFRRVMLAEGDSAAELAAPFHFSDAVTWVNILGPTHSIEVNRQELEIGTLDAVVLDAALDPAVSPTLEPGKNVRLQALVSGTWENVFTGKIDNADATYTFDKKTNQVLTSITLAATDNIGVLAGTVPQQPDPYPSGARGYAGIANIPAIVEPWATGVPWRVNDWKDHVTWGTAGGPTNYNNDASVLDQIALTRDGEAGFVWVDRHNVLVAYSPSAMPITEKCQFTDVPSAIATEEHYSGLKAGWTRDEIINRVHITLLKTTGYETEEIPYGPYSDEASVRRYKPHSKTFTMQGTPTAVEIEAFARAIIDANKTPVRKASELVVPVKNTRALGHAATLDLYDLVGVKFSSLIDAQYRITSIKHQIETDSWLTTYGFGVLGAVASPASVPQGQSGESTDGSWIAPAFTNGWINSGGTDLPVKYMRKDGWVYLQGTMKSGTLNTAAFTLPAGYRPAATIPFGTIANSAFARLAISGAGVVNPVSGSNVWYSLNGIFFQAAQ